MNSTVVCDLLQEMFPQGILAPLYKYENKCMDVCVFVCFGVLNTMLQVSLQYNSLLRI